MSDRTETAPPVASATPATSDLPPAEVADASPVVVPDTQQDEDTQRDETVETVPPSKLEKLKGAWVSARAPLSYAAWMGVAQLISLIFFALVARRFGDVANAELITCYTFAAFIATIVDFGEATNSVRLLVENDGRFSRTYVRYAGARLALVMTLVVLGLAIAIVHQPTGYAIALGTLMSAQTFFIAAVRVHAGAFRLALCFVVEKLVTLGLFLFVPREYIGTYTPILFICCGLTVSVLICFPYWPLRSVLNRIRWSSLAWHGGQHMGVATIISRIQQMDVAVLTLAGAKASAGAYAAVNRWNAPFNLYSQSVAQYMLPQYTNAQTPEQARRLLRQTNLLLAPASLVLVALSLVSPWVVTTILGSQYSHAGPALSVLCFGALVGMYAGSYYTFVQARHLDKLAVPVYAVATIVQFVGLYPAVKLWGAAGASACFLVGQIILALGCRRLTQRDKGRVPALEEPQSATVREQPQHRRGPVDEQPMGSPGRRANNQPPAGVGASAGSAVPLPRPRTSPVRRTENMPGRDDTTVIATARALDAPAPSAPPKSSTGE